MDDGEAKARVTKAMAEAALDVFMPTWRFECPRAQGMAWVSMRRAIAAALAIESELSGVSSLGTASGFQPDDVGSIPTRRTNS